ncbi:hypothetical protein MA16_Dca011221 [Dendrobium catenatum]|uniref:Uncharacterized protein n=1 Tax=Dendrobium catenatum TaxID=906689 RepID=A0A2I0VW58_9ASPA|nr:hypothetical protein MA16_Dca011221 [Dendrobium catenatum]
MSDYSPLSGDLVFLDGRCQGEKDSVDDVVDLQFEVEEGRQEDIYSSLKIIHKSVVSFRACHSWRGG